MAIYDMYQTFVDYDEEYAFYNAFIQENNCKTILEIGSGTAIWPNDLKKTSKITGLEYTKYDCHCPEKK
jgi:capsular polysaccharide biosynthesis protein